MATSTPMKANPVRSGSQRSSAHRAGARGRAAHRRQASLQMGEERRIEALTPRQKEILRLVVQGLTNREVADQLDISVRTVEVHRFNLMRRLKVRNVAQLVRQALIMRLLPKNFASS